LPTDTRHVLNFRKDLFRGVDGIDSKNGNGLRRGNPPTQEKYLLKVANV